MPYLPVSETNSEKITLLIVEKFIGSQKCKQNDNFIIIQILGIFFIYMKMYNKIRIIYLPSESYSSFCTASGTNNRSIKYWLKL